MGLFQVWQTRTVDSCLIIIGCAGGSVRSTIDPLVIEDDVPENPSLVIDASKLPRIFFRDSEATKMTRACHINIY